MTVYTPTQVQYEHPERLNSSYLFLRMKLLLENLKLCWGTHDILLPMLLSCVGLCASV